MGAQRDNWVRPWKTAPLTLQQALLFSFQDSSCSLRTNCHPGDPRLCSTGVPCTAQFIPEDFPELGVADRSTTDRAKQAGPA